MLRKRMSVAEPSPTMPSSSTMEGPARDSNSKEPARALDRLPTPDFAGYLRKKGERYNSWKLRYCVLSGPHLYYLKSENVRPTNLLSRFPSFPSDASADLFASPFSFSVGRQVQGIHQHGWVQGHRGRERQPWILRVQDHPRQGGSSLLLSPGAGTRQGLDEGFDEGDDFEGLQ